MPATCPELPTVTNVPDRNDDTRPKTNPDAEEVCNEIDDNCDGKIDDLDCTPQGVVPDETEPVCGCQSTVPAAAGGWALMLGALLGARRRRM